MLYTIYNHNWLKKCCKVAMCEFEQCTYVLSKKTLNRKNAALTSNVCYQCGLIRTKKTETSSQHQNAAKTPIIANMNNNTSNITVRV